ncbi:GFA family protein [uncultured Tateyamaria sp.]|uniref:GFA family protein n=1 Tax=uncultured Tateyamaria sp. TaxID=455651 RepID=UPI00262659A6|nr:GFA family protein [uncultured Tateyamaria sp.]
MTQHRGSCHCGFVRFAVRAEIDHARICNCSICHKRGALIFRVPEDAVTLDTPLSDLTLYTWGSQTAKDYFCPRCGILPFRRPSAPTRAEQAQGIAPFDGWAINLRCLDGFDATTLPVQYIPGADILPDR